MAPVSTTEDILTAMSSITETAGRLVASATSSARNGSLDVNDIVGTYQDASTQATGPLSSLLTNVTVLVQAAAMFGVCVIFWLLITAVRKCGEATIFRPRDAYEPTKPPDSTNFVGRLLRCLEPLISGSEGRWADLQVERMFGHHNGSRGIGMDSMVYILFGRLCSQLLFIECIYGAFLANVDYQYNYENTPQVATSSIWRLAEGASSNDTSATDMLTYFSIQHLKGNSIWYHTAATCFNTFFCIALVLQYYEVVNRLRTEFLKGRPQHIDINEPDRWTSEVLDETERKQDRNWILCTIGSDIDARLRKLYAKGLNDSRSSYLVKEGWTLRRKDIRIAQELKLRKKAIEKLECHLQAVAEQCAGITSDADLNPKQTTLLQDTRKAAYEACQLDRNCRRYDGKPSKSLGRSWSMFKRADYHLIGFATNNAARLTMKSLRSGSDYIRPPNDSSRLKIGDSCSKTDCVLAPCVYDVAWENVESSSSRRFSHVVGTISQIGAMLAYAVLTIAISFGASQESWSIVWPGFTDRLKDWTWLDVDFGKLALDTLTGPIPAALTALVRFIMPIVIEWFGDTQKPLTYSFRDRRVVYWLFSAYFLANWLVFSCASVLLPYIARWWTNTPDNTIDDLAIDIVEAYLNSALFWLTWLPATLFASLLVHTGFHRLVETKLKPIIKNPFSINKYATIREIAEAKIPDRDFPVGERSTNLLFMLVVVCSFSTIQPVVLAIGTLAIFLEHRISESELIHVFEVPADVGGPLWGCLINRLLFLNVLSPAITIAVVSLKGNNVLMALPPLAPMLVTILLKIHLRYDFRNMSPLGRRRTSLDDRFDWGNDLADESIWENDSGNESLPARDDAPDFTKFYDFAKIKPMLEATNAGIVYKLEQSGISCGASDVRELKPLCVATQAMSEKASGSWEPISVFDILNESKNMWRARVG